MDYTLYIKNSFLKQTIGGFTSQHDNMSCETVKKLAEKNVSWYVPKGFVRKNAKVIESIFNRIDGRVLNKDALRSGKTNVPERHLDGKVEKAEIFQLVKDYYKNEKGQTLSDSEVSNMSITKLLDIFMVMIDKM